MMVDNSTLNRTTREFEDRLLALRNEVMKVTSERDALRKRINEAPKGVADAWPNHVSVRETSHENTQSIDGERIALVVLEEGE